MQILYSICTILNIYNDDERAKLFVLFKYIYLEKSCVFIIIGPVCCILMIIDRKKEQNKNWFISNLCPYLGLSPKIYENFILKFHPIFCYANR